MNNIIVENYKNEDLKDVINLLVDSFRNKFLCHSKLEDEAVKTILALLWDIDEKDDAYIHYVAKENNILLGAILVQVKEKKKNQIKLPLFKLASKYGFINICKLLLKMAVLDHQSFKDNYIEHIAVSANARGKGIGSLLILRVEKELRIRKEHSLTLAVAKDNPATSLYRRHGFKVIKDSKSFIKGFVIGEPYWYYMKKVF